MDAAGGILVLLALGLTFRLIIAYLLPGSGFKNDIGAFQFWASELARNGIPGFYDRAADPDTGFFADYTPGYLYVLWAVGIVGNLAGGPGDLIKIPPILGALALAYLVWSMVRELGGSERAARIGAIIVLVNPITWFDSVVWGQVDSVGVVFLLLALRELWRDRPERSAVLAAIAALIKPQLGILIPIVAIVVIRRALWPKGAYGNEERPEPAEGTTGWEQRVRGPIRILTTGAAGFLTTILVSLPFGLSLTGLIAQIFKTAGGYPYLSVNAYNPWALVSQTTADGRQDGIAVNGGWVCDSTILASPPQPFQLGPFTIPEWSLPGSPADRCPDGFMIGAFPAALVGMILFLIAAGLALWLIARRPDRITMLTGLAFLALAFFVLPTRVHERYLFPLAAIGAILAAVSVRWRIAYILSSLATFANMYAVLTWLYRDNPRIDDWLGIGPTLTSYWGVAIAAVTQAIVFAWVFLQLREDAVEGVADDVAASHEGGADGATGARWLGRPVPALAGATAGGGLSLAAAPDGAAAGAGFDLDPDVDPDLGPPAPPGGVTRALPRWAAAIVRPGDPEATDPDGTVMPAWQDPDKAPALGPVGWFRARLADRPVRADRSRELRGERGGRLDRLDLWFLALLAVSLLTVRFWRLSEPYQMHFDEVYHPRTATEFLQYWRYDISHDIYEWTHPHLAKYAMALGLMAFGEDKVGATSRLGVAVTDATIEPRRDDGLDAGAVEGDRLWVATGSQVRAYDLATRELAGTMDLPGAVAVAYNRVDQIVYAATRTGEIHAIDAAGLDLSRRGPPVTLEASPFTSVGGPISRIFVTRDSEMLLATLDAGFGSTDPALSTIVAIDVQGAFEVGRPSLRGVTQVNDTIDGEVIVGTADGVALLDSTDASVIEVVDVGGPVGGVVGINDIQDDPVYAAVSTPEGPRMVTLILDSGDKCSPPREQQPCPRVDKTFTLPGERAGRAFYDLASRMVHVEGSVPAGKPGAGATTIYVIEPHGNAVYADAALPWTPAAIVMDDNQEYQSSDRQQLLAFDAGGEVASVEIGRHALAWRVPGVIAGVLMALFLYVLARLLFQRRAVAVILGIVVLVDGMLFAQSRIGMNDAYVGLGIIGAYTIFTALWLHPGNSRRHWLAFAIGVPIIGAFLGFALAAKWVAAYAIGGLGILTLTRSALGRLILIAGLLIATTALGYVAISVAEGQTGGNWVFLGIMVALIVVAVLANILHPIAWTWEEVRFAVGAPAVAGLAALLFGLARGGISTPITLGPISLTPIEMALLGFAVAALVYAVFLLLARAGFGPLAPPPPPDDPMAIVEPPAEAPRGWLRLGSGFGLPAIWLAFGLLVIPVALYVVSYLPWAAVENHQIVEGFPAGHTGQTLLQLTSSMYGYHNNLSSAHPASSPWWAWAFDLKPVWFYEEGFAGATSASIYDAGNLVAWWLAVPALAFVCWQAFKRRSPALALIAIGFAVQWISWARIDRAAFQYHYYTALPFLFLALGYFLAELWHGPSRRTWLLARLSAGVAVLGPFLMYLFHRPLCAVVRVTEVNEGSQACPTLIPEVTITPRAVAMAVVIGLGVLLLLRELLATDEEGAPVELSDEVAKGGWRGALARIGLGGRWANAAVIAAVTTVAFIAVSAFLQDSEGVELKGIPVEPLAVVILLALSPVAAYVATARDSRRFVVGALGAMAFWFVLWYPNIAALPLPEAVHNAYQGFLPTYLYPFQFWVMETDRPAPPPLFAIGPAVMLLALAFMAVVIAYSAWTWRIALAERRRDRLAAVDDDGRGSAATD